MGDTLHNELQDIAENVNVNRKEIIKTIQQKKSRKKLKKQIKSLGQGLGFRVLGF
jgi:predicted regulator of amino acid metabolism with ACT domain